MAQFRQVCAAVLFRDIKNAAAPRKVRLLVLRGCTLIVNLPIFKCAYSAAIREQVKSGRGRVWIIFRPPAFRFGILDHPVVYTTALSVDLRDGESPAWWNLSEDC